MGIAACGDDSTTKTPDASKPIDAAAPVFGGFDADEGGEVRFEYVRFLSTGLASARATAFFFEDPGSTKRFPFLNLDGCTNVGTHMNWPTAANPIAERKYFDAGQVLISGGPEPLQVPRNPMMFTDPFARQHPPDSAYFYFKGAAADDGLRFMTEKTKFNVTLTGSAKLPSQVFRDVIYVPADITVPFATPLALTAGQDQTITFTTDNGTPPAGFEIQSLVGFTGANGPAVVCVEKADGSVTIPAAMIDIVRAAYPQGGTLARQTLTHVVRELNDADGPTGRRIDFIGVWCLVSSFTVP